MRDIHDTTTLNLFGADMFDSETDINNSRQTVPSAADIYDSATDTSNSRPRYGLDWGGRGGKLIAVTRRNEAWEEQQPENLLAFINENPGAEIVLEAAFESYLGGTKRDEIVLAARANDVRMLISSTRYTRKIREEHGLEKTDSRDARILYDAGTKDRVLLTPAKLSSEMVALDRTELTKRLVASRRQQYTDETAQKAIALMPAPDSLPERVRARLCKGIKKIKYDPLYRVVTLAETARFVLERGGNRCDYERWLGLYGRGYPSLMRSNLMHHGYSKDNQFAARYVFAMVKRALRNRARTFNTPQRTNSTPTW